MDPFFSRHSSSALLSREPQPEASNEIKTETTETYGRAGAPLGFRLGNGGAGYTGLLRHLCEAFIQARGDAFRIEWVANHSRHTHIALLANIVQVALTYEPEWEDLSIAEGWARRVTRAFHDRFVLVGPRANPAGVLAGGDIKFALRAIARLGNQDGNKCVLVHTRGDGSATHYKELQLWGISGVDLATSQTWRQRVPLTPYEALVHADRHGAYLLTDRATFLTAQKERVIPDLVPYVEHSEHLLNPCSALINIKAERNHLAVDFAHWLGAEDAQEIIGKHGRDWPTKLPVFATKAQPEVDRKYALTAQI